MSRLRKRYVSFVGWGGSAAQPRHVLDNRGKGIGVTRMRPVLLTITLLTLSNENVACRIWVGSRPVAALQHGFRLRLQYSRKQPSGLCRWQYLL